MAVTRLQDELLHEFREEKRLIHSQTELLQPLSASLRRNAALRLADTSMILVGEIICYALLLAAIAVGIFMNKLYPFYLLTELSRPEHSREMGLHNVQMLQWSVYALLGLIALVAYFLARALARIRQKNAILSMTGGRIKTILSDHEKRRIAIDDIERRHFSELPAETPVITDRDRVNDIRNPGYDFPGDPLVR